VLTAILVPGGGAYTTRGTLFDLADAAFAARNATVERISWEVPRGLLRVGPEPFVRVHVAAALTRLTAPAPAGSTVVVAKSLGSYAAALAAEHHFPAIWLTPVLTDDAVVAAITANSAPALLIGGTADEWWVPDAAKATGKQVLTIPGGDHSLRVPGPLRRYVDVLATVGAAMDEFLDNLPAAADGPV
jgi:hypothetical protein